MPYTDFHYTPTGTGVISGKEVLEQTEDAINDLGTQISGDVQTAIDTANNALNTANTASADAQNAVNTANTAYTAATNAQNTANTAQNTASNALTAAQNAQNDVNALGNRVTTAEGNITQNTNAITGLTTRMGTAEGNITTLQNDVVTAQGTATSAQNTATLARGQAYVVRYANVTVSDNSTVPYANLNNTDNIKANDLLLDTNGKIYQISAVDTANETVSVTTPLTQLAVDSDVVHKSGDETIGGLKTFENNRMVVGRSTDISSAIQLINSDVVGDSANGTSSFEVYGSSVSDANKIGGINIGEFSNDGGSFATIECNRTVSGVKSSNIIRSLIRPNGAKELSATVDNDCKLGTEFLRWSKIYGTEYYYGSNNVEFSTKFVTTDTAQTISGEKTFSNNFNVYNSDTTAYASYLNLKNQRNVRGSTTDIGTQGIQYQDKNNKTLTMLESRVVSNGNTSFNIICYNIDGNNQVVSDGVSVIKTPSSTNFAPTTDNSVTSGRTAAKWSDVLTYKVNNLEPSSLSLPSGRNTRVDISSYFTNLGNGDTNSYSVSANGYIYMQLKDIATVHCFDFESLSTTVADYIQTFSRGNDGQLYVLFPVKKDHVFKSTWHTTTTVTISGVYFIPCQGNI